MHYERHRKPEPTWSMPYAHPRKERMKEENGGEPYENLQEINM